MRFFFNKLKRKISYIKETYKKNCIFSRRYSIYKVLCIVYGSVRLNSLAKRYRHKADEWILSYLKVLLKDVIDKYADDCSTGYYVEDAPIWVCWWTGIESAPDLVKQCIKSIYGNSGNHPVKLVTKNNYIEYIDIPSYIIDKVDSGQMCVANFSDYLRVSLLEKYGGLWLDATIFCTTTIPEEYFKYSLFTCKRKEKECAYISKYRWTSFCLGGYKGHVFYRFFKEALETYWKIEDFSIDYLLVDYLIETAYRNISIVQDCMKKLKYNNFHIDDMQAAFNEALPAESFDSVIKEDTILYKLSWRETYSLTTNYGQKSIYARFLKMDI